MMGSIAVVGGAAFLLWLLIATSKRKPVLPVPDPNPTPDPNIPTRPDVIPHVPDGPGQTDPTLPVVPVKPWVKPADPNLPGGEPDPEPEPDAGPDPNNPTPNPTPGFFYQVIEGDNPSRVALRAYAGDPKALAGWAQIAKHALNAWMLGHPSNGIESGGFWPKWNGYQSAWGSGNRWGLYYIPKKAEFK